MGIGEAGGGVVGGEREAGEEVGGVGEEGGRRREGEL